MIAIPAESRRFASGCLTVTPQGDGSYRVTGELVPLEFLVIDEGLKAKTAPEGAVSSDGSGGDVGVEETSEDADFVAGPFYQRLRAAA